ncbi:MAG: fused MFS/spermidine synthase [Planctomycetota bacterium]
MSSSKNKKVKAKATDAPPGRVLGWHAAAILAAFALSGVAGLIHEVAWTRLLRLVMGSTTFSIATVLAMFMGGLALGGYYGGRWVDRRRDPLRLFAVLEVAIGVYCLFLPWLVDAIEPIYRAAYRAEFGFVGLTVLRFVLCGLLLLPPATLMGATLPVLTRWWVKSAGEMGRRVGRLYAINTLGAAVGAAVTSFVLIPNLGLQITIFVGVACNWTAAAVGWWLHQRTGFIPESSPPSEVSDHSHDKSRAKEGPSYGALALRVLLLGYVVSGLAAMVFQIAWTRVLTLLIGSSVYAFGLILTAFIIGLGLGALAYGPFSDRVRAPLARLGIFQIAIGLSALCVVPVFAWLPYYLTGAIASAGGAFWQVQALEFGLVLAITLVPTLLMGAAFPLVTQTYARRAPGVGQSVGTVYTCNTIGAIVGSFLGGFVLIPLVGIQNTLYAAVTLSLGVGVVYTLIDPLRSAGRRLAWAGAATVIGVAAVFTIPAWEPERIGFAPFIKAASLDPGAEFSRQDFEERLRRHETLYYHEGISATVMVRRTEGGVLDLLTNGRVEAKSQGGELQQRMLAHIPMLLHPEPRSALVIGLASGITLDAASQHPVQALDCVELSAGVIEATRYFAEANNNILENPRVNVILSDGRNHVALTDRKYDVIISQPSDPATAGVATLFTQEFFEACYDRLNDRGLVCVWLKGSTVEPEVFRSIVGTFGHVFDDVGVWSVTREFSEYMLVGSRGRMEIDIATLDQRIRSSQLTEHLKPLQIHTMPQFLGYRLTGRDGAAAFAGDAPFHTDDLPRLEFTAPRSALVQQSADEITEALFAQGDRRFTEVAPPTDPQQAHLYQELQRISGNVVLARYMAHNARRERAAGRLNNGVELMRQAAALNPFDSGVQAAVDSLRRGLDRSVKDRDFQGAITIARRIVHILPQSQPDRDRLDALLRDHGPRQ